MTFDFLIKNGMVYDPALHKMERRDLAIVQGKLARPEAGRSYRQIIDADGCIVTPGLIDFHVHYFATESGSCPDASSFCNGITTAVDAGSAGASTYGLFRRADITNSQVRILSDLLVASGGQPTWQYHENMTPDSFDEAAILQLFQEYPGELVGLKARLSRYVISEAEAEESVGRMLEIAEKAGVPLVIHVTDCAMPLDRLAGMLRPGDVICHIFQNRGEPPRTCLDRQGKVLEGLWAAKRRGVLFDACHGVGNYDLTVCRAAIEQGFTPDIISSDNNSNGCFIQPLHSLPRILSKYLDFGMPLEQVLDCATIVPAKAIGRREIGSLADGTVADVAIFRLKHKPVHHCDINHNTYEGTQVLVPQMTFFEGRAMYCQADFA